ncbi:MAG: cytochrome [Paucimonas sp.]|nr:cytochrome [Paucimonas sp.]
MAEADAATSAAPVSGLDPFSDEYILDSYPQHAQLRDAGPVVLLEKYQVYATGRYAQVRAVLEDAATYCSGAGVGIDNYHKVPPWRPPSMVLETDPPEHTRNRAVISRTLSPAALRALRAGFEEEAAMMVDSLLARDSFDAVKDMGEAFPLKVFANAIGIPKEGRHHLVAYGNMVFNGMGPHNKLYDQAMANPDEVSGWVWEACQRRNLTPDGLGIRIFDAVDSGILTDEEGARLVRSFLSAGTDTTAAAIVNALYCFATNPGQWQALRERPDLARAAFEEILRFESPFQTFFRTTTRDAELAGVRIPAGEKVMLSLGAANRDPRQWSDPDRFDITRTTTGHVGFGGGIHGCVGQMMARLELEVILRAMAARVSTIEITGEPRRMLHNTLRGMEYLPVRLRA